MCYTMYYYRAESAVIGLPVCDTIVHFFPNNGPAHCVDVQAIKFDFSILSILTNNVAAFELFHTF